MAGNLGFQVPRQNPLYLLARLLQEGRQGTQGGSGGWVIDKNVEWMIKIWVDAKVVGWMIGELFARMVVDWVDGG